ncbi:hypothetical protein M8818_003881 [Zalaria obscura]|uniref:Uncharacterized protein n=1 Tax=Zalaria obscura TaxID=2024903 RepID=A0ACC3SDN7_9PEZI
MASEGPKNRKTLHDYFGSAEQLSALKRPFTANGQVGSARVPPGLSLFPDFITAKEETSLLQFLDAQSWRTDLSRRTMHYGGTYCLMPPRNASPAVRKQYEQNIITAPAIPLELNFLIDRMVAEGLYTINERPEYCIVNEYLPGQGISAHVENFRFGEPVCSLTLAGGDSMRFHELSAAHDGSVRSGKAATAPRTGLRKDVWLASRSLVVLRGDARSKWQHEIVRGRKTGKADCWRRVSLTFRVMKSKEDREKAP